MSAIPKLLARTAFRDACLVMAILVAGTVAGSWYIGAHRQVGTGEFGQSEFGAAVAFACGRGFVNPLHPTPELAAFLARTSDTVSCDALPRPLESVAPNFTQKLYRYLMIAVALQWKWSGVSWSRLTPLFGLAFGVTLCVTYGLFRLAAGPLAAAAGVVPIAVSVHHLSMLPELRDYAKAPFVLGLLLLMAHLALPPYSRFKAVGLSALVGLALGIGFGFRNDIIISVPPFVAVVALLLPVGWREELKVKAACLAVAAVVFVVSAWPILRAYQSGSNTGHVSVLGLMSGFDGTLGLTRPPYDIGTQYLDEYASALVGSYSKVHTGKMVWYMDPDYDRVAVRLVFDVLRHWPADIFVRGLGAALRVLELPFSVGRFNPPVPPGVTSASAIKMSDAQAAVLRVLSGLGPLLAVASLLIIGSTSIAGGIAALLLLLYYAGFPAVQFQVRHFFHLEVIGWWALVFVCASSFRAITARIQRAPVVRPLALRVRGALVTAAAIVLIVTGPLAALRLYQQRSVPAMLDAYAGARQTRVTLSRRTEGGENVIAPDGLWLGHRAGELEMKYLAVEYSGEACGAADIPVTLRYDAIAAPWDFTSVTRVAIAPGAPTRQFAPVYYNERYSHFADIRIPGGYGACLKSVSVIDDLSPVGVPVEFRLTRNARATTWFQRLAHWENTPMSPDSAVAANAADLVAPSEPRVHAAPGLTPTWTTPGVADAPGGHGWVGRVTARLPEVRLLQFQARDVAAGSVLVASGVIRRGGLQIGLLDGDTWFDKQGIDVPGPFTVLLKAPAGRFGALVSDFSMRSWRREPTSLLRLASRYAAPWLLADEFDLQDVRWMLPGA